MSALTNDGFPVAALPVREHLVPVQDSPSPCPYIDSMTARMPLYYPIAPLHHTDIDTLLAAGFRRSGMVVYYTRCAPCHACEPTRVEALKFAWTDSLRRVRNRAARELTMTWQVPSVDEKRVWLYNQHRQLRGLGVGEPIDAIDYDHFLTQTCFDTLELEVRYQDQIIGISIMDIGKTGVSAVYTHFDPAFGRYSLGTLAVLKQIEWAIEHQRTWVYLGLYVASNPHLNYKARFLPQERLRQGQWRWAR